MSLVPIAIRYSLLVNFSYCPPNDQTSDIPLWPALGMILLPAGVILVLSTIDYPFVLNAFCDANDSKRPLGFAPLISLISREFLPGLVNGPW